MCATFEIEEQMLVEKLAKIEEAEKIKTSGQLKTSENSENSEKIHIKFNPFKFGTRILPSTPAPTIIKYENEFFVYPMRFALIPAWSKDSKPKFATHNARIETIKEKPSWKPLFGKRHCLIPMTSFVEPIYTGKYAGNMMKFILNDCLLVPALFDTWHNKETNEKIVSFAIITTPPGPYVEKIGHDRSPVFIQQVNALNWLNTKGNDDRYFYDLIHKKVEEPKFSVEIDRKLKAGWEKKSPDYIAPKQTNLFEI